MKKYIVIALLGLALLVSLIFNFVLRRDLENESSRVSILEEQIEDVTKEKNLLEEAFVLLESKNEALTVEHREVKEALSGAEASIAEIDEKLKADGDIIGRIDAIAEENAQWREALNLMTTKFNELEAQLAEIENAEEEVVEEVEASPSPDVDYSEWLNDVDGILTYINNRIVELEDASSTLPALSLERIMINQEVVFLNNTVSKIEALRSKIATK